MAGRPLRTAGAVAYLGERPAGVTALGLATSGLQPAIRCATARFRLALEFETATNLFVARIESSSPRLLIVDSDLLGCLATLSPFARSLHPDIAIAGVCCYWSDRDCDLRADADVVLHKPPRIAEWEAALDRLGIPRLTDPVPISGRVTPVRDALARAAPARIAS